MRGIKLALFSLILLGTLATVTLLPGMHDTPRASGTVAVLPVELESTASESAVIASNDDYSGRQWAIPKIMAPQAWEVTSGEPNVVIAVLDTGIDDKQNDLAGKVIAEVNFTDSPTAEDVYGHGTHIAGIIAAWTGSGTGVVGLAPDCRLMNVKVADDQGRFDSEVAAKGVTWAVDHGAKVINMSLVSTEPSASLEEAINYAWNKGAVVVAAAGNLVGNKIVYPAYYSNCIAVAATDSDDHVASWSSHGDWVDVAAPGVDIYSTLPDNKYSYKSGTSMAAAHVSGLAGLLFVLEKDRNNNGFINDEVRAAIENGCDGLNIGLVKGRINAFHAVNRALTSN
ncbi:MAG: S8 family serine peptidase [Dehalococcoidia bacterium]|nr:S8 family serine peptidase [Dehalococcoidia bacterium]